MTEIIAVVVQLIFLEGILSIDNAAVLGALATCLPTNRDIPWPHGLRFMHGPMKALLGRQQSAALKVGLLGAYIGRGTMLFFAGLVISNRWIRVVGAAYLLFLAVKYFAGLCCSRTPGDTDADVAAPSCAPGFWRTVLAIELADLAFSVDNVVAAVALSPRFWVTLLGVGIGIIVMRFAAGIFAKLIRWEPALSTGAYLLIAAVGIELILETAAGLVLSEIQQFAISASIICLTILFARTGLRRASRAFGFLPKGCMALCCLARSFGKALSPRGGKPDGRA